MFIAPKTIYIYDIYIYIYKRYIYISYHMILTILIGLMCIASIENIENKEGDMFRGRIFSRGHKRIEIILSEKGLL